MSAQDTGSEDGEAGDEQGMGLLAVERFDGMREHLRDRFSYGV